MVSPDLGVAADAAQIIGLFVAVLALAHQIRHARRVPASEPTGAAQRTIRTMARSNVVLDLWAPLSHKAAFDRPQGYAPTWVDQSSWRRLAAYCVLKAYCENVARDYLRTEDEDEKAAHREYGDADLIVARV